MGDGSRPTQEHPPEPQRPAQAALWPDWDEPLASIPAGDSRIAVGEAAARAAGGRHLTGRPGRERRRGLGGKGRHDRRRGPAGARDGRGRAWATGARLVTVAVIVAAVLIPVAAVGLRLAGPHGGPPGRAPVAEPSGDLPPPPGPARAVGNGPPSNLLDNWSFERDLGGWRTVGPAELEPETGGHTSGSAVLVRVTGGRQAGIGEAARAGRAAGGERYLGSAWVRGDRSGTAVTLCVFSDRVPGRRSDSEVTARTARAGAWVRLMVVHRVPPGGGQVGIEVLTAKGAVVVDEVTLTKV